MGFIVFGLGSKWAVIVTKSSTRIIVGGYNMPKVVSIGHENIQR